MATIVKVGQVWAEGHQRRFISRVDDGMAIARDLTILGFPESDFGKLNPDGSDLNWDQYGTWALESNGIYRPGARHRRVKVQPGQVWNFGSLERRYISRLDGIRVITNRLHKDGLISSEDYFGVVDQGGMPDGWDYEWSVECGDDDSVMISQAIATIIASRQDDPLLSFFKSVPSGHCACNILRTQCSYHR